MALCICMGGMKNQFWYPACGYSFQSSTHLCRMSGGEECLAYVGVKSEERNWLAGRDFQILWSDYL